MFHPRICCIRKWGNALYHLSICLMKEHNNCSRAQDTDQKHFSVCRLRYCFLPSSVGLDFNSWDAWLVHFKSDLYKDVFVIINVMQHQISHFSGESIKLSNRINIQPLKC